MSFLTFNDYRKTLEYDEQLNEKLIMYNQGKRYGQVVFVVGGAASGKGFAISNFMEKDKFKIRDVDEWKSAFIKLDQIARRRMVTGKGQRGVVTGTRRLNLRKSQDVFNLHQIVDDIGVKDKTLNYLLGDANNKETLPNIIFDITGKDIKSIAKNLPMLMAVGYEPQNIHLTWVLTKFSVAVERNQSRERVVPDDIMFTTHMGASQTMSTVIRGQIPRGINGGIYVILNNRENTVPFVRDGKPVVDKNTGDIMVKDFTYVTLKKPGKRFVKEKDIQRQLYSWIQSNVPEKALKNIPEPEL